MTESYGSTGPTDPQQSPASGTGSPAHAAGSPTRQSAWGDTAASGTPVSSQATTTPTPTGSAESTDSGMKDKAAAAGASAKEGAGRVLDAEKHMARDTAHEAKTVAHDTVADARNQAKDLFAQTREELSRTAGEQLQRFAGTTSTLSSDLGQMASSSEQGGLAASLVEQASTYLDKATQWVEGREPGDLVSDVNAYARRHPGTFMAVAAGLGLVAGRVLRGAKDDHADDDATPVSTAGTSTPPRTPAPTTPPAPSAGYAPPATNAPAAPAYRSPGYGEPGYERPGGGLP